MDSQSYSPDEAPRVLVVDDEKVIREILADFLSMEGFFVRTAEDGSKALVELSRHRYDLVLSDLKMPNMGGLELLGAISKHTPNVVTVIMTGFGTVETAIDAMKRGAYDYILKPFKVEEVVHTIRRGLEKRKLQAENLRLKEALSLYKVSEAIAASLSLDEVMATMTDAAIHEVDADQVVVLLELAKEHVDALFAVVGIELEPVGHHLGERLDDVVDLGLGNAVLGRLFVDALRFLVGQDLVRERTVDHRREAVGDGHRDPRDSRRGESGVLSGLSGPGSGFAQGGAGPPY